MAAHRVATLRAPLHADVYVPGSKSIANRALVCAALAPGESIVSGTPHSDDTATMVGCLDQLGFGVERHDDSVVVFGGVDSMVSGPITLQTGLAGTTSRFLTALAALGPGPYTIDGLPPLRRRPMGPLHQGMADLGVVILPLEDEGHLPVSVQGPFGAQGHVRVAGDISSQFISALMMIAPLLPAGLRIDLTTPLVSRPYLGITAAVMAHFGVTGIDIGETQIVVPPGAYSARSYTVEPDATSAGYPLAAAALCGGEVSVRGLGSESVQGDAEFCHVLATMGCDVEQDAVTTTVRGTGTLHGVDIDMSDMSDLVPTLAVVAAFADGPTHISGVGFIRGKESDRLGDLCAELRGIGVLATEQVDGLVIEPSQPHAGVVATHHDHRLAMALGLLGLRVEGIQIDDPDVVTKSWPGYWAMLEGLQ